MYNAKVGLCICPAFVVSLGSTLPLLDSRLVCFHIPTPQHSLTGVLCYNKISCDSKRGYPTARQIRTTDFVAAPYQRLTARHKLWLIKRVLVAILLLLPQIAVAQPGFIPTVDVIEPFDFSSVPAPLPNSVLCNCYAFAKREVPDLPSTKTILSSLKTDGRVAVFYYPDVGLHHYAVVRKREGGLVYIEETNYQRCRQGTRAISEKDPHLLGFF